MITDHAPSRSDRNGFYMDVSWLIRVISVNRNQQISVASTQTHGRSLKTQEILITSELSSLNLTLLKRSFAIRYPNMCSNQISLG